MSVAIETIDLKKSFKRSGYLNLLALGRQSVPALIGVSFEVKKGELFGVLGPNGAGKTTLIKILATLVLPDSGAAFLNGFDIYHKEESIRKIIGYITSEERSFYWRLTGRQNLHFFATLYNLSREVAKKRISNLVALLDFKKHVDKPFMSYSSGMKQRLSIARGLLYDPEILLMDEPTRSLDPLSTFHIQKFIKERLIGEQGKTILLATHDLSEAEYLCDRLAILSEGKIVTIGKIDEIRTKLGRKKTVLLKIKNGAEDILDRFSKVNGISGIDVLSHSNGIDSFELELQNEEFVSSVLAQLVHMKVNVLSYTPQKPSLKEIFEQSTWKSHKP